MNITSVEGDYSPVRKSMRETVRNAFDLLRTIVAIFATDWSTPDDEELESAIKEGRC